MNLSFLFALYSSPKYVEEVLTSQKLCKLYTYDLLSARCISSLDSNKWTDVVLLILVSWKFLAASSMNMLCAIVFSGLNIGWCTQ